MNKIKVETDRLVLQPLFETQAGRVLDFVRRNRVFLAPWEPKREPHYYSRDEQARLLRDACREWEHRIRFQFWITPKDSNKILGNVHFFNIMRASFQSCTLSYKMDKDEQGKGYMTEAVSAGVEYVLAKQRLHRVEANVMPRNKASLRVLEKAGFEAEGLSKKYIKINGVWEDHVRMVKLGREDDDGAA